MKKRKRVKLFRYLRGFFFGVSVGAAIYKYFDAPKNTIKAEDILPYINSLDKSKPGEDKADV